MRCYAIGDIHGQRALLEAAHSRIAADRRRVGDEDAPVVHVGDLVDRGPDSRGVVDLLMRGIADGRPWIVLKGNHDRMFTEFLSEPGVRDSGLRRDVSWLHPALGGGATLASYGVHAPSDRPVGKVHADALRLVPREHRDFVAARPACFSAGGLLFVHAGIMPGIPLERQHEDDLLWIREPFLNDARDHGLLVVHGHTAIDAPRHHGNRVNIDSSAGFGGPLSAVVIEGRSVWVLEADGRRPLTPR